MDAQQYVKLADGLEAKMHLWRPMWDRMARLIMPRRAEDGELPSADRKWHSTEACHACNMLASGHMTYITPVNQRWFAYKADGADATDEAQGWYAACSEVALDAVAASNFYTELHECYIDRCLYGTGCLLCEADNAGNLNFRHIQCGSFSIAENSRGVVDTLVRSFKFSAQQAAEEFGEDALGDTVKSCLGDPQRQHDVIHEFVHIVRPRVAHDPMSARPEDRPYESVYVSRRDARIVKVDGYYEFPYMVTRFLKWGSSPYGMAPGYFAEPDIERSIFLDDIQDTLAEVAAFPRILELANQVGEVDMRAGGRTIISPEAAQAGLPREWATQGRYDIALDRQAKINDSIDRAYHVDMLQVISSVDRQMTATEVNAREGEKVLAFSPSYTQMTTDLRPMGERIFAILYRAGRYPQPPSVIVDERSSTLRPPKMTYQNKISAALDRLRTEGLSNAAQVIAAMSQVPQWQPALDIIDPRKAAKEIYRTAGAPEDVLRSDEDIKREDEQRAAAMMQEQEMMMQQQQAATGKDAAVAAKSAREAGLL